MIPTPPPALTRREPFENIAGPKLLDIETLIGAGRVDTALLRIRALYALARERQPLLADVLALLPVEGTTRAETWTPTPDNINALPNPVRRYIHDLETRCDPAGDTAALALTRDQNQQLSVALTEAQQTIARLKAETCGSERCRCGHFACGHLDAQYRGRQTCSYCDCKGFEAFTPPAGTDVDLDAVIMRAAFNNCSRGPSIVEAAGDPLYCEKHPGHVWGECPGGPDCPGPGEPLRQQLFPQDASAASSVLGDTCPRCGGQLDADGGQHACHCPPVVVAKEPTCPRCGTPGDQDDCRDCHPARPR